MRRMKTARFRFYAELNDFLPVERRMRRFSYSFSDRQTVKHLIEAIGVPHTEVDLVLVNGQSVAFSRLVEDGDDVSVYPVFEAFDITALARVRPQPLRHPRFVLDAHLGKLSAHLRLMGFDTLYRNDYGDVELAAISKDEHRILLTKDRGLLKRGAVTHGYYIRETAARRQLIEVLRRFDLAGSLAPFTRCLRCNGLLEDVEKGDVAGQVPPRSRDHCDEFRRCDTCAQVYWNGSHYRRMKGFVEWVRAAVADPLL